ncbi:MAG: hypothetical protein M5U25_20220 [Planctomycetota bacterium]|nr:hypothetical protein [Planctomycetota bacterium]
MSLPAELAYLFRHAVIRDAAYGLQPPTARAALHAMALEIIESLATPDTIDGWAEELADHARQAMGAEGADRQALQRRELAYLQRAAEHAAKHWHNERSVTLRERIAEHPDAGPDQRIKALLDNVDTLMRSGGIARTPALLERAEELARDHGDRRDLANVLAAQAQAATLTSRHADANRLIDRGITLARELREPRAARAAADHPRRQRPGHRLVGRRRAGSARGLGAAERPGQPGVAGALAALHRRRLLGAGETGRGRRPLRRGAADLPAGRKPGR